MNQKLKQQILDLRVLFDTDDITVINKRSNSLTKAEEKLIIKQMSKSNIADDRYIISGRVTLELINGEAIIEFIN